MSEKYELTRETYHLVHNNRLVVLHRIKALKCFKDVKCGDLGGWVESKSNLSQEGDCWIYDNGIAIGNSEICGNAILRGNVLIADNAKLREDAIVDGYASICGSVEVRGDASIYGQPHSMLTGDLVIYTTQ